MPLRPLFFASVIAALVAGTISTLAQIALWLVFASSFPAILWRDARLAAAIVLGPDVLASMGASISVMAVATVIHFALSLIYAMAFCLVAHGLRWRASTLVGAALGAALYGVNMYGFTAVFPWFAATRDWITFAAHLMFGASATLSGKWAFRRLAAADSPRNRPATPRPEDADQ